MLDFEVAIIENGIHINAHYFDTLKAAREYKKWLIAHYAYLGFDYSKSTIIQYDGYNGSNGDKTIIKIWDRGVL